MIERRELLMRLARKYIWWKTPENAVAMPERVMAQVMDIGDYLDVQELAKAVGEDALREVLVHAQAGQFNERSWAYWNYRLGLGSVDYLAPMPVRRFPGSTLKLPQQFQNEPVGFPGPFPPAFGLRASPAGFGILI